MRRLGRIVLSGVVLLTAVIILPPAWFLFQAWRRDGAAPVPPASAGVDDASHMNASRPAEVIRLPQDRAEAERQITALVKRAVAEHRHIAISGAHHSMGGHTLHPGEIVLDMLPFSAMKVDPEKRVITVGAGARWHDVIPYLDQRGFAVAVMQSNNDFSVGGSISVNCHGWQNDSPPIASTVESFRIVTADGSIRRCSREENRELFSLALGGYGLMGVILDVTLRIVPNEYYSAEAHEVSPADYNRVYHELTRSKSDIGMAYGRINVAPNAFLERGIITLLRRRSTDQPVQNTVHNEEPSRLKRVVFRASADSDYGKNLRWRLERIFGETGGRLLARNQIMNEPSDLYANREPGHTDILHEYFIPVDRLGEFIEKARPIFLQNRPDLLNITVRNVEPDTDAFLNYTHGEVFGLVMLFNQARTDGAEKAMVKLTRELIDAAISCGGTYYLPYRLHASLAQFETAYPQGRAFFQKKRQYDPTDIFENEFYLRYGKTLLAGSNDSK